MTVGLNGSAERKSTSTSWDVTLRTGPPTREELLAYYPAKFTWTQLKTFINSGDLGTLKRDKALQARYQAYCVELKKEYGTILNYLLKYRLQWGKPDRLTLLPSVLDSLLDLNGQTSPTSVDLMPASNSVGTLPKIPPDGPQYFTANAPPELISIIQNDWPYSVPADVEHTLIWTRLPIIHPAVVPEAISDRIRQDGLWGFTGSTSPPPSPSDLPKCLPALTEWGITMDSLIRSEKGTKEEDEMVRKSGEEVAKFVRRRWVEKEWETAWFVNPPRIQSVPDLAHVHVFARRKSPGEIEGTN